jgi:CheY-like chemotaxis protein
MFVHLAFQRANLDHKLMIVSDGAQALDYLRGEGPYSDRTKFPMPSVVLLDLRMPGVDGFEVLKQVRHEPRLNCLPITVFTGSNDPEHHARAHELGANSVVVKPFKIERFFEAVKSITDFWLDWCKLPKTQSA